MITVKKTQESVTAKKADQLMSRKSLLQMNQKRDIWNNRRRFGY